MKKEMVFFVLFVIFVLATVSYASINYFSYQQKMSAYRTYEISGHLQELKLVTTFPNEGLYVGFDNGEYRFVDSNYWWTYAQLSVIKPWNNVTITYERNDFGNLRVLHIQEVPYE